MSIRHLPAASNQAKSIAGPRWLSRKSNRRRTAARERFVRRLSLEPLELRQLLSATPQLLADINADHEITTQQGMEPVALGSEVYFLASAPIAGLWKTDGTQSGTSLVRSIGSGYGITNVNGTLYFAANDGTHGDELWKSDGTSSGTALVKDINPGSSSSYPGWLTNVGGTIYFSANDGTHGDELWKTDGTSSGTVMVGDIAAGVTGADPSQLVNLGGRLLFIADDNTTGQELWASDGSSTGTVLVDDINPGTLGSSPFGLTAIGRTVLFAANDGSHGTELWSTDGTSTGTLMLDDIDPGTDGSDPSSPANVDGTLFFRATDGTHGDELWKSNGTSAGTVLVDDLTSGSSDYPYSLTNVGGTLLFNANDELWKSDGTSSGTTVVGDVEVLADGALFGRPTNVNGTLFFTGYQSGFTKLWKSDGTSTGTAAVASLGDFYGVTRLTNAAGTLYFDVMTQGSLPDTVLWKSDGTSSGTSSVAAIQDSGSNPYDFTPVGSETYFAADDGTHGSELWKTDGTSTGTSMVVDLNGSAGVGSDPGALTNVGGTLFFAANPTGMRSDERLYATDGTSTGTVQLLSGLDSFQSPTNVNGVLYFFAQDSQDTDAPELWKSDGTASGTVVVAQVSAFDLTNVDGTLYFEGDEFMGVGGEHGFELWKSDGTSAGTVVVDDMSPGPSGSFPDNLTNFNGTLFFAADPTSGYEIWKSDGTSTGTMLVDDPAPDLPGDSPFGLTEVGANLFFVTGDSSHGYQLWSTDGTSAGTRSLVSFSGSELPGDLLNVNGTLYFSTDGSTAGDALWTSDGTSSGTVQLASGTNAGFLMNADGTLYFSNNDGTHGSELWTSDGTSSGTILVDDIDSGAAGSYPSYAVNNGDTLFFAANDGTHGSEPWTLAPAGLATHLVVTAEPPATVTSDAPFNLTVAAEDAEGNVDTSYVGSVTVRLGSGPGALAGTATETATDGVAIFSGLSLNLVGSYTLDATSGTLISATASSISVTPGAATQLVIIGQPPTSVDIDAPFGVTVTAEDSAGNVATGFDGSVGLAIATGPSGATLGGTTSQTPTAGVAVFSGLALDQAGGYTLKVTAAGLAPVTTDAVNVAPVLTISGGSHSNDNVTVTFTSPTQFVVENGGTKTSYSTSDVNQVVYNAPGDGTYSKFVFDNTSGIFNAVESLASTTITAGGFSFTANGVSNLYIYGGPGSTATVNVANGAENNFFVGVPGSGYSYIANPATGQYSELSGFGSETVTGSGGTTYAYIYSTSGASTKLSPGQATFTAGGVTSTLTDFPTVYVVGAADGSDSVTMESSGGAFVGAPGFSSASGTFDATNFVLGALFAANVIAVPAVGLTSDTAAFYSYSGDKFTWYEPGPGAELSGNTTNVNGQAMTFTILAGLNDDGFGGYTTVSVYESGGTDTATLETGADRAAFFESPTATSFTVGQYTVIVNTFAVVDGVQIPVSGQIAVTEEGSGGTATLDDAPGGSRLAAQGDTATLTNVNSTAKVPSISTISLDNFASIDAVQTNAPSDTVDESAVDYALTLTGNWVSG